MSDHRVERKISALQRKIEKLEEKRQEEEDRLNDVLTALEECEGALQVDGVPGGLVRSVENWIGKYQERIDDLESKYQEKIDELESDIDWLENDPIEAMEELYDIVLEVEA